MAWEFDVFGRIRRESESATGVFYATEQAQRGVFIALVADVAQSYFILRELDLELDQPADFENQRRNNRVLPPAALWRGVQPA